MSGLFFFSYPAIKKNNTNLPIQYYYSYSFVPSPAMNGCPHKKPYDQLVNEGLNGQSSVRELPYIGSFFEGRLRRLGFRTVNDLVLHFNRKSAPEIYDGLTRLLLILDTLTTPGPETSVAN